MNRPYIICHMVMSIDGKVTGNYLYTPECEAAAEHYYEINRKFHADAYACGRITMEGTFIPLALEKIKTQFGIQTLLLEGGSILNGALLKESLVDQLSLVLAPIVAETGDKPLFYESALTGYELTKASPLEKGCLWLQYESATMMV